MSDVKVTDLKVRPEVARFALLMEAKLRANDFKRHWSCSSLQYLSARLTQERKELSEAIATRTGVGEECADIANFAMMIADKCGGLPTLEPAAAKCGLETEASD
jgi:hypothetical protein